MQAVALDGCAGWLHDQHETVAGRCGVLICPDPAFGTPPGHRSFCALADELAADGYPVLRLDYPDVGDTRDLNQWWLWQQCIGTAIDWLRAQTGAARVAIVGMGIGATLAAQAAERRGDVPALVLLDPVLCGRSYLRQVAIEQMVKHSHGETVAGRADLHGLQLSPEAARTIEAVDLRQIRPPANCQVAIYSRAESAILSAFLASWRNGADSLTSEGFDGLDPLVRRTSRADEGPADTARLLAWLRQAVPSTPRAAAPAPSEICVEQTSQAAAPINADSRAIMLKLATNALFQEVSRTANTFIAPLNRDGSKPPIFWIPSVTGSGADTIGLSKELGPDQPFYCLRVPHKKRTGAYGRSIDAMASDYAHAIKEAGVTGPVVLGTWSAGVVVGYAMLPHLKALGIEVDRFVVIDYAIYLSSSRIPLSNSITIRLMAWLRDALRSSQSLLAFGKRVLDEAGQAIRSKILVRGASEPAPHPMAALIERKRLKNDEREFVENLHDAAYAYRPRQPCDVPVLLFVAKKDDVAPQNTGTQRVLTALEAMWGKEARWSKIAADDGLLRGRS
jgi:thioesterase domain-containing protein